MPISSSSSSSASYGGGDRFISTSDDSDGLLLLLCGEDASSLSDNEDEDDSQQKRPRPSFLFPERREYPVDERVLAEREEEEEEVVMSMWVEMEGDYSLGFDYRARFLAARSGSLDPFSRHRSVAWILKVGAYYGFRPATAYLAVNYMDRFLSSHDLPPPQPNFGWPMQLLSVACLSLAAKMEETIIPSLLDLQVEDAIFIFEPRMVQRMELLVLAALNWRLRSITPFAFIDFFAGKVDSGRTYTGYLVSRATQIVLTTTPDVEFLGYRPSSLAAAAVICAACEPPVRSFVDPGSAASWCSGLTRDGITSCYQHMREVIADCRRIGRPRIAPLLRSTTTSTSSSSSNNKRRKLNNYLWVDDDKDRPLKEGDHQIN